MKITLTDVVVVFLLVFTFSCKVQLKNIYNKTYNNSNQSYFERITFQENNRYTFEVITDLHRQKGAGNWIRKNDTLILESDFQKEDIKLARIENCKTNLDSFSRIEIKRKVGNHTYIFNEGIILINDTLRILSGNKVEKKDEYTSMKVVSIHGLASKNIPLRLDRDTVAYLFELPIGNLYAYPFFNFDRCLLSTDSLVFLGDKNRSPFYIAK